MVNRPIKEAQEAAESARETVKNLCPWLPDPYQCDDCGRVVVPADDWDEVKRQATTHDNGGFDIETVVSGVKVVWSNTISQPKAEIKLND